MPSFELRRQTIHVALAVGLFATLVAFVGVLGGLAWALGDPPPRRRARLGARVGEALLAVFLPLVLLAPWLRSARTLLPTGYLAATLPGLPAELHLAAPDPYGTELNDVVLQLAPWEREVRRAYGANRLPLWSDLLDGGSDLWSNPQAGVLSPVALVARFFPWRHYLVFELALKTALAFLGASLLARCLGARRSASWVAGAAFACGGAISAWALFPLSTTVAWVPWLAAGMLRLARRPTARALAGTAAAGAAVLLSGHPETAFGGFLFAVGLAAALRRRRLAPWRGAGAVVAAGLLAACLAAPVLLPVLERLPATQRVRDRTGNDAPRFPLQPFVALALDGLACGEPYSQTATLWPMTAMPFCGRAVLLLAALGAVSRRRGAGLRRALVVGWLLAILLATGAPPGTPRLLRMIELNRLLPLGDLALALAAALALTTVPRRARRRATLAAALGALALAGAAWPLAPVHDAGRLAWYAGAAVACGLAPWMRRRWAPPLPVLAWTLCELVPWSRALLPPGDARLFYPSTPVIARTAALAQGGRATGHDQIASASLLPAYGIAEARPHNPMTPAAVLEPLRFAFGFAPGQDSYTSPLRGLDHPLLSFLDVRAVISNAYLPVPARLTPERFAPGTIDLVYVNPAAVGRFFLAAGADPVAPPDLARWIAAMADPRRVALRPADAAAVDSTLQRGAPRVRTVHDGLVEIALPARGRALLASSVPAVGGWRATANDGRALPIVTANGAYLAVPVPDGVTGVTLRFRPPGLAAGTALAALALGVLAAVGGWARRTRRRSQGFAGSVYSSA